MTIPKRYEDLTVLQFQKLEELKQNKDLEPIDKACLRLSILSGKNLDHIENMHPKDVHNYLTQASFLLEPLTKMECKSHVILGLNKFKFIDKISDYNVAQQKDFTEFVKINENDYVKCLPELLAICHLQLGLDGYKYRPENHFKNVELFKKAKLKDCLGAVFFYSRFLKTYNEIIAHCLESNVIIINPMMTEIMSDKEFLASLTDGVGSIQ